VVKNMTKSLFKGAVFLGAFFLSTLTLLLPWSVRCAFARFLMGVFDRLFESKAILSLGVKVRWRRL